MKLSGDVALFSNTPVTFVPTTALMSVEPLPVPEFVIVPTLLIDVPDKVIPEAVELLLFRIKLPLPLAPPDNVNNAVPLLFVRVVPLALLGVSKPVTFNAEVVLPSVMPVTLAPTLALISVLPVPVPEFVIVPELLIAVPDNVIPEAVELLLFKIRLPIPLTPPDKVIILVPLLFVMVVPLVLLGVSEPVTFNAEVVLFSVMVVTLAPTPPLINVLPEPVPEFVIVPELEIDNPDNVMPETAVLLLSRIRLPVPLTLPDNVSSAVLLFVSVVAVLLGVSNPLIFSADVVLFSMMLLTFASTFALIRTLPEPVPEFVIVPVVFTSFVDNVIPEAVVLLFFKVRLPVPVTPPDNVNNAVLLFVSVVPLELIASGPLIVNADVALFSVMAVTDESTFELIVVVPEPAPIFVTVPVLLIAAVESAIVPPVALLLIVKLLVPVTPPLNVVEIFVPVFPSVNVPVVVDASTIGFAYVNPVVPIKSVALLLPPALFPSVTEPVPKAFAEIVPVIVPASMVVPLV